LSPVYSPNDPAPRHRKRSAESSSPPPSVQDVAKGLAAISRLSARVLRLYGQAFEDAYSSFAGSSVFELAGKAGQGESNAVMTAVFGKDMARAKCYNAASLVADALARLGAARDALDPAPPPFAGVKQEDPDLPQTQRVDRAELAALQAAQRRREREGTG
jgi:hypothetical protein